MFRHEHCDTLVLFLQCVIFTVLKAASLGRWTKSEKRSWKTLQKGVTTKRRKRKKGKEKRGKSKTYEEDSSSNLLKIS